MYQALYRKYRPLVFEDVVGQEHVINTLKNQIHNNKVSHAYMFTGTRGTGKTTCAKILARAVNCEKPQNGNPCNECSTCKGILNGSLLDVFEIDAASNNGVDNIRELREDVIFTPAKAKYKVYIIDEVHMLSNQAFNALLKTLEEPPAHVIFVFATTEINKVPQTILSRCQRFDFKRITLSDIRERVEYIAEKEGIQLDLPASMLIAKLADGAMRDALSILDRCINISGKISLKDVEQTVGICSYEEISEALYSIAESDTQKILRFFSECKKNSKDSIVLFTELCSYLRDMIIIKLADDPNEFLNYDKDKLEKIVEISKQFTLEGIIRAITVLQSGIFDISKYKDKSIMAELTLIKLTNPQIGLDYDSLNERIAKLESIGVSVAVNVTESKPIPSKENNQIKSDPKTKQESDFWNKALDIVLKTSPSVGVILKRLGVNIKNNILYINCPANSFEYKILSTSENVDCIKKALANVSGVEYSVSFSDINNDNEEDSIDDAFNELINNADDILIKE